MATYRELHGKAVKTVTTNPTDTAAEGQIWFNSTDNTFKSAVVGQAWSSGGPLSTGRYLSGSLGTQTAGVQIIGSNPPNLSNVEHYNGTGWSEETNYPAAGQAVSGAGTQTAGIAFGGSTPSQTANAFDYNGTAWTAANSLPYTANNIASCGLEKTSVIGAVGRDGSSGNSGTNKTVTFDGTDFANGPNINTTRMFNNSSGAGTGTAALIVGGFIDPSPNAMTNCEEYNGSAWTATGTLNVATGFASAFGIQTNAVAQTNGSNYVETEGYDGSTWTVLPNMSVSSPGGLYGSSAGSTGDAGWVSSMGPAYSATEEFNKTVNTITAGAWASTPSLGTARRQVGGFGHTTTTAVCVCGQNPPALSNVEEYDGSSWSEVNNMPVARIKPFASGTLTAGLAGGGESGPTPASQDSAAEYDGTNWTATPAIPAACLDATSLGTQTASLVCVGVPGTAVLYYNGSTWTSGPTATPTAMASASGNGTQTEALVYGEAGLTTTTLEWDGSAWTSGGGLNSARARGAEGVGAPQNAAIYFGGNNPSTTELTATEGYDGTSWSTRPNMATARRGLGGAGIQTSALGFAGYTGSDTAASEEFTGETTSLNVKTLTQS